MVVYEENTNKRFVDAAGGEAFLDPFCRRISTGSRSSLSLVVVPVRTTTAWKDHDRKGVEGSNVIVF
jgi:hypothetical protein